ncbi:MAG: hypothetical protein A2X59_09970, partial [Nitrospirae bacterium GWC2_42_7]
MKRKMSAVFSLMFSMLLTGIAFSAVPPSITPVDVYTLSSDSPARIAADNEGKIYVTIPENGLVKVFSNNGLSLGSLNIVESPLGIAIDQSGRLYITDTINNNSGVYDSDGHLFFKLGSGDGEFAFPNAIAVSVTDKIYVTDSALNMVKVYSTSDGAYLNSFGSNILRYPTGITIDEAAGEVFVIDYNNLYIRIYDLDGNLKRSIKGGGGMMGAGKLLMPLGLALDSTRLYVTDAFNSVVAVFDKTNGAFLSYIGNYGSGPIEFKTPSGIAIDKDGKMFVSNTNNQRIDVLGIDVFNNIKISPAELDFAVYAKGPSVTQAVNLISDVTSTTWDATVSEPWASLSAYSGTTSSSVDVTVDPSGVLPGNYNVDVEFKTSSGVVALLKLNVEVIMPVLSIAPSSFNFTYQKNSTNFPSGALLISSIGAVLPWSGYTTAEWLTLENVAGTAPSTTGISVNNNISSFALGTYTTSIGIDAGTNVIGSPASVSVTVNVVDAGDIKVTTNLDEALFNITGPQNVSGSGKSWTETNVMTGTYTISFDHISGYVRPYSRSFTVESGKTAEIIAEYTGKKAVTHIVAGSGGSKGKELSVLTLTGDKVFSVVPFHKSESVRVAVGDLDKSGTDKIAVTDYVRSLKVYSFEGTELASLELSKSYKGADIAVGDIDNDGKTDILVAVKNSNITSIEQRRVVKVFNYSDGQLQEKAVLFTENIMNEFSIALGDINGDGILEVILADSDNIRAFSINAAESRLTEIWTVKSGSKYLPRIAAGDIDDDGLDEIGLSITQAISKKVEDPVIRILNG